MGTSYSVAKPGSSVLLFSAHPSSPACQDALLWHFVETSQHSYRGWPLNNANEKHSEKHKLELFSNRCMCNVIFDIPKKHANKINLRSSV